MKRCPNCGQRFSDDYSFCLDDGTLLILESPISSQDTPTQVIQSPRSGVLETRRGVSPWIYILIGALAAGFISSVYLLISQRNDRSPISSNSLQVASYTPTVSVNPTVNSQTRNEAKPIDQPSETVKSEQIKTEITEAIMAWVKAGAARDIDSTMSHYAETVDYYRKPGSSKSFVRNDKQQYYNKFQTASITTGDLVVIPSSDGNFAEALFDKSWTYDGNSSFSGKVRQQLRFRYIAGRWLITGEKDIKIYYVNK